MTAIANLAARAATGSRISDDTIKVMVFSCLGLLISLVAVASFGLDLAPGFF